MIGMWLGFVIGVENLDFFLERMFFMVYISYSPSLSHSGLLVISQESIFLSFFLLWSILS